MSSTRVERSYASNSGYWQHSICLLTTSLLPRREVMYSKMAWYITLVVLLVACPGRVPDKQGTADEQYGCGEAAPTFPDRRADGVVGPTPQVGPARRAAGAGLSRARAVCYRRPLHARRYGRPACRGARAGAVRGRHHLRLGREPGKGGPAGDQPDPDCLRWGSGSRGPGTGAELRPTRRQHHGGD